jgi:hypothetical protein
MGVLIQPFIDGAIATGVAVTENPFKEGRRGALINSQAVGATVTGAIENELPEQYLVSTWTGGYYVELISHSSLTSGALILGESDVHGLTDQLFRIHDTMLPAHAESANAMDVEFALTAERRFVILQARPYRVVYDQDRAEPVKRKEGSLDWVRRKTRNVLHRLSPDRRSRRSTTVGPPPKPRALHAQGGA